MKVLCRPRQAGKTYDLVQWVLAGSRVDSYPGWSRILLTHSIYESVRIRSAYPVLDYHQVFSIGEFREARLGRRLSLEVAVDNVDIVLADLLQQRPSLISMTGETING